MCLKISNKFTLSETDAGRKERDQNYRLRNLEHLLIKTITSRPGIHFHTIPLRSHCKMRLKGKMNHHLKARNSLSHYTFEEPLQNEIKRKDAKNSYV
jgi:hypothetical protein